MRLQLLSYGPLFALAARDADNPLRARVAGYGRALFLPEHPNRLIGKNGKCRTNCPAVRLAPMSDSWTVQFPAFTSRALVSIRQTDKTRLKSYGHFLLRRVDFTPQKLSIEFDRPRDKFVSVTFAIAATEFAEAS